MAATTTGVYEYDELGRTKKVIDALLNETEYEYNELGQQTAM